MYSQRERREREQKNLQSNPMRRSNDGNKNCAAILPAVATFTYVFGLISDAQIMVPPSALRSLFFRNRNENNIERTLCMPSKANTGRKWQRRRDGWDFMFNLLRLRRVPSRYTVVPAAFR